MPGIVGLITKMPRDGAILELHQMVAALCHEPSYQKGTFTDSAVGVYIGWVERETSFCGGMPLSNETGDLKMIFSGEEFPESGMPTSLQKRGHLLGPQRSSYLIHLYEENPRFLAELNGRFNGLVVDRRDQSATLFNDRFGIQRLYYHQSDDAFYFAAEAKAILAVRPELRQLDLRSLGEFVACGCVLENRTLFKNMYVLPGASAWRFRDASIKHKNAYFQPKDWESQPHLDEEAYYQTLREVLLRRLPGYFHGERVGMSLTGGLDSRIIMASFKSEPGSLPCYSFGGMVRECEDVKLARKIAEACRQPYAVIPVGNDFLSKFPRYAERTVYLTDGCTDVGHSPDLFANECAAAIAPARLTGNYGSEVLRGNRAFKPVEPPPGLFNADLLSQVNSAKETYNRLLGGHPVSFAVFRQAPWHHYGLLTLEQTQLAVRSPFLDNELVRTVFRAPHSSLRNTDLSLRLIRDGDKSLLRIRTDRGLGGEYRGLAAAASRKFLDVTTKAEYAYDYGMPQWLARIDHMMSAFHFERLFLGRQKFYHFRVWYRDFLAGYIREMLLDSRSLSRPYLHRKTVQAMVHGHITGNRNYTLGIHKILTLELVHRLFIDGNARN